nr:hypothetical protein [Tanacetum cinerariifolium]
HDLVDGLPKFKYSKDHQCSVCERGKSKKASHLPKWVPSSYSKLELLHMDLCGPMRVASINGKGRHPTLSPDAVRITQMASLESGLESLSIFTPISMGYGDYVIGDSVISRVYYVKGLGHNLFSVGQFCDSDLEVAFRKHSCFVRDLDGVDLIKGTHGTNLYTISVENIMRVSMGRNTFSSSSTIIQNCVVERRNHTLVEAARTMLIFSKALTFLWAGVVATACYTQNRSLIHTVHNKTPYELVHDKNHDLFFLRVFGALCYPTNDSEDLGKLQAKADIGFFVGSRLMPSFATAIPYVPLTNKELEMLFQPMFDEYFDTPPVSQPVPPASAVHDPVFQPAPPAPADHVPVSPTSTPASFSIEEDAPSTSISSSSVQLSPSVYQGVVVDHTLTVNPFAPVDDVPFVNILIRTLALKQHQPGKLVQQILINLFYHMNISGNRPTLIQLETLLETPLNRYLPVNNLLLMPYCWFEMMQEEIHKFDCLQVWELVPPPDCIMVIALKWIYKVKLDEYGDVLKNKASLKQAHRAWYDTLYKFLLAKGFSKGVVDPTLFIQRTGKHILHVHIYVDDIIFASTDPRDCLQISQSPGGIFLNQAKYANEILKKFRLDKCDLVDTPMMERSKLDEDHLGIPVDQTRYRRMIRSLMYLTASRHDLVFAVCMYAKYQSRPTKKHLEAVKQVFRYLQGTINMSIWYLKDTVMELTAYADADHTENSRSKHIDIWHHYIREQVDKGVAELYFVRTEYQLADIFTKAFPRVRFELIRPRLGMRSLTLETLKRLQEELDE